MLGTMHAAFCAWAHPGLTCARTLVHDTSCTADTTGYHTITESNLAAQKSGSWTWRDTDVAHLSKALSINLPLYARAARKQSSKAPLRELSNQSLHSNSSQSQGEQLDELHVVVQWDNLPSGGTPGQLHAPALQLAAVWPSFFR